MRQTGCVLACVLFAVTEMAWGMTADDLVQKTGLVGGFCCFPRVGAGEAKLAIESAQRPTFVVHLLSPRTPRVAEFRTPASKVVREFLVSQPTLLAPGEVLLLKAKWAKYTAALSRADGKLLWKQPTAGGSYRALTALAVNGLWVGGGPTIDLVTGNPTAGPRFISSGCGPATAVPGCLITGFGAVSDMQSGKMVRYEDIKSPCDVGSLVAEGVLVTVPSECGCNRPQDRQRALGKGRRGNGRTGRSGRRLQQHRQLCCGGRQTLALQCHRHAGLLRVAVGRLEAGGRRPLWL
jgi:hypothetical protein